MSTLMPFNDTDARSKMEKKVGPVSPTEPKTETDDPLSPSRITRSDDYNSFWRKIGKLGAMGAYACRCNFWERSPMFKGERLFWEKEQAIMEMVYVTCILCHVSESKSRHSNIAANLDVRTLQQNNVCCHEHFITACTIKKVYLGNLDPDITEDELRQLFKRFGKGIWVSVVYSQETAAYLGKMPAGLDVKGTFNELIVSALSYG
ncbi:polyadenylate-binding protein RBP47B' [Tanacetum coccineum]